MMSDLWYVTNLRQIYGISSVQRPKKVKKRVPAITDGDSGCHLFNNSYEISRFFGGHSALRAE